jgi:carboxypeptidase-like protein
VMRAGLIISFFLMALKCFSQENTIVGIVFDKESKDRVASVNVHNTTTDVSVYNNLKGEFKIAAKAGDQIIFSRTAYHSDTIKIQNGGVLAIYMSRLAIQLKEVAVHDTLLTPEKRLEAIKQNYTKAYGPAAYDDFLTSPSSGGAGLSIDAIWNSFSREGRNAARLREIIQADYEQNVIDYRFNRTFVGNITGLKDEKLTSFMFRYRPGFYTTQTMSDYEFISMIRLNLKRYLRNQRTYSLPPLKSKNLPPMPKESYVQPTS